MNKSILVKDLLKEKSKDFRLRVLCGKNFINKEIRVSEVNRPGLALAGFLAEFRSERVQIIGRGESLYCQKLPYKRILKNLNKMFENKDIPCVIVTCGIKPSKAIVEAAKKNNIPLITTQLDSADLIRELTMYLDDKLAPSINLHGVLVNVYGLGVLIQGDAGIGKSECAIELLKRGHVLVADDLIEVKRRIGHILVGSSPKLIKNFMEVRGIGIVDVELLFGVGAILPTSIIELVVCLKSASGVDLTKYDRTGLDEKKTEILGVSLPLLDIPVTPGRNLAVLIEIASLNQRLKNTGYFAAKKLNNLLMRNMRKNK